MGSLDACAERTGARAILGSSLTSPSSEGALLAAGGDGSASPSSSVPGAMYEPDMEETVSVLIRERRLWEDTMDMTDWARLLLAGPVGAGRREGDEGGGAGEAGLGERAHRPAPAQWGPPWPHHTLP